MKKESFLFCDVLVVVSLLFFLATHVLTMLIISHNTRVSGATYAQVAEYHEASPVSLAILKMDRIRMILSFLISPSLVLASYWVVRRKRNLTSCEFMSVFFFIVALINVLNDLSAYLGMVAL